MINVPNSTLLKVNFRCKGGQEALQGSSCIVYISVGQPYHEGEKFIATMDLVNKTFSKCYIVVCDTLQRHTLQMFDASLTKEEAYRKAFLKGQAWVARNKKAYQFMSTEIVVSHWDEWLHHPSYINSYHEVLNFYQNNASFQHAIDETTHNFLKRQRKENDKKAFALSKQYLLEEYPILIPLWATTGAKYMVYPKKRTSALQQLHQHFIEEKGLGLLNEVTLKFDVKRNQRDLSFSKINVTGFYDSSSVYVI